MKKLVIVILLCSFSTGCAVGDDSARQASQFYQQALAANQDGRFGAGERLLVDAIALGDTPTTASAESLLDEIREAGEARALVAVRDVSEAQRNFMALNRRYALTIQELVDARILDAPPSGETSGYEFRMRGSPNADAFDLSAEPVLGPGSRRFFFVDRTGVIRSELGEPATAASSELSGEGVEADDN